MRCRRVSEMHAACVGVVPLLCHGLSHGIQSVRLVRVAEAIRMRVLHFAKSTHRTLRTSQPEYNLSNDVRHPCSHRQQIPGVADCCRSIPQADVARTTSPAVGRIDRLSATCGSGLTTFPCGAMKTPKHRAVEILSHAALVRIRVIDLSNPTFRMSAFFFFC